jgi:hypothetical protein
LPIKTNIAAKKRTVWGRLGFCSTFFKQFFIVYLLDFKEFKKGGQNVSTKPKEPMCLIFLLLYFCLGVSRFFVKHYCAIMQRQGIDLWN